MKITRIDLHEVVVPLKTAWHSPECGEERFDLVPKWVVEAHTDDGLIGLGETPPHFHDGGFDVPAGPGLGVRLDREALKNYCRRVVPVTAQSQA